MPLLRFSNAISTSAPVATCGFAKLRGSQPQPSPAVIRLNAASALSVRQTWRANTNRGSLVARSRLATTI